MFLLFIFLNSVFPFVFLFTEISFKNKEEKKNMNLNEFIFACVRVQFGQQQPFSYLPVPATNLISTHAINRAIETIVNDRMSDAWCLKCELYALFDRALTNFVFNTSITNGSTSSSLICNSFCKCSNDNSGLLSANCMNDNKRIFFKFCS